MKTWVNGLVKAATVSGSFVKNHKAVGLGAGLYVASKAARVPGFVKSRADVLTDISDPGKMLPTSQGRFGNRTDALSQSPTQGVRFNFRRR